MEIFDFVRTEAVKLRSIIVSKYENVDNTEKLIKCTLEHLGIGLNYLSDQNLSLWDRVAVFDGQFRTILCKKSVKDENIHFQVIAHEIGHAVIHWNQELNRPVNEGNLYSRFEKRELQADAFASEFILPRSEVNRLHIEQQKTPNEISKIVKMDEKIVEGQILKSLLLPELNCQRKDSNLTDISLSPLQESAISHTNGPYLLISGPGTGKTLTLIKRVTTLVKDNKVNPANILVLTFSRRIMRKLEQQLRYLIPEQVSNIFIGTFHSFGLELTKIFSKELNLPTVPKIFESNTAIEELRKSSAFNSLPNCEMQSPKVLSKVIQSIIQAKGQMVDWQSYQTMAKNFFDEVRCSESHIELAKKYLDVAHIYREYELIKTEHKMVDFGDLIMLPTELLEKNPTLAGFIRSRYKFVFIDGLQDLNHSMIRLVNMLTADYQNIWANGDDHQSIFGYRGASIKNLSELPEFSTRVKIERDKINFRSHSKIVDACNKFSNSFNNECIEVDLITSETSFSDLPLGSNLIVQDFETELKEKQAITKKILELKDCGINYHNQAVLCRTNSQLNEIVEILESAGIPVLYFGDMYSRPVVIELLSLMKLVTSPNFHDFRILASGSRYHIPTGDQKFIQSLMKNGTLTYPKLIECIENMVNDKVVSDSGRSGYEKLLQDIHEFDGLVTPWEIISKYVFEISSLIEEQSNSNTVQDKLTAFKMWQFLMIVKTISEDDTSLNVLSLLNKIQTSQKLQNLSNRHFVPNSIFNLEALNLLTVHDSKGLEFDAVHLSGFNNKHFPRTYQGPDLPLPISKIADGINSEMLKQAEHDHNFDEQNLCYVAFSRAKSVLSISYSKNLDSGETVGPSPNLELIR